MHQPSYQLLSSEEPHPTPLKTAVNESPWSGKSNPEDEQILWLSDQSISHELQTDSKNRQDTAMSNNLLTLSKSCKKEISKVKTAVKAKSDKKLVKSTSNTKSDESLAQLTSKSSVLICNENLKLLEAEGQTVSPSKALRKS